MSGQYFEINPGVGGQEWPSFCGQPTPSSQSPVFDILKELGLSPRDFVDKANRLFDEYGVRVPDDYPKDKGIRDDHRTDSMNEFAACVGLCISIKEKHDVDVRRLIKDELIANNSRSGILHANSVAAVAFHYLSKGSKVRIRPERRGQRNPDLDIDGTACEVKTIREYDWWKEVDPSTGKGRERLLREDLCYDIGTFIRKTDGGCKGIWQADVVFADLTLKSFGFLPEMCDVSMNGLPGLKKGRIVFFAKRVTEFLSYHVDFDLRLWDLVSEDRKHSFGIYPPRRSEWRERLLRVTDDDIGVKMVSAVDRLLRNDADLLKKNASERSITHRLAVHLEQEFPRWHVDCEYNRHRDDPKRVEVELPEPSEREKKEKKRVDGGSLVLPDIIVHCRGTDDSNLLVIEAKKSTGDPSDERDMKKLEAYKRDLGYRHALFLKFTCGPGNAGVDDATAWV